jgi:retron-type reverse transcriptase
MTAMPTLMAGWEKVYDNHGAAGGDGVTVTDYARNAVKRLSRLSRTLQDGTFVPGPCRMVAVPKAKGGYRPLAIPSMDDRIAHTALAQTLSPVLEPQFERSANPSSISCTKKASSYPGVWAAITDCVTLA